jgi:uncharacterized protein
MISTGMTGLKELHDLRLQLEEVTGQIEKGPRQFASRQAALAKKKAEAEAMRARLTQQKMKADQKNLQLRSNESKIHDLGGKLNAAASNREFDALKHQIEADKMANSVLEDEILEILDGCDAMQGEIREFEREVAAYEAETASLVDSIKQAEPGLKRRAEELEAQIAEAEKILPNDILPQYRRLVQNYGASALSPVQGKACGECYVSQRPQTIVELRAGKCIFCTCGRLMYLVE